MRNWNEKMYFGAMPGRYESIEEWHAEIERHGIDRVVCLAPTEEIKKKSPCYWLWRQRGADMDVTDVPIPDYGIPEDAEAVRFWEEAAGVAQDTQNNRRVFIHCGAGVGRTGTFATAVLVSLGYDVEDAVREIEPLGSWPETPRQRQFVKRESRRSG